MHRRFSVALLAVVTLVLPLACGGDREERGLTPATEEAVPADPEDMGMTEKERRKQLVQQMDEESRKRFDGAQESNP